MVSPFSLITSNGGHFPPTKGGQFAAILGGQFPPTEEGQFQRFFQHDHTKRS